MPTPHPITRTVKRGEIPDGNPFLQSRPHDSCGVLPAGHRIDHDSVDEVIHHGGDAVDTAEPLVKAGRILSSPPPAPPVTSPLRLSFPATYFMFPSLATERSPPEC